MEPACRTEKRWNHPLQRTSRKPQELEPVIKAAVGVEEDFDCGTQVSLHTHHRPGQGVTVVVHVRYQRQLATANLNMPQESSTITYRLKLITGTEEIQMLFSCDCAQYAMINSPHNFASVPSLYRQLQGLVTDFNARITKHFKCQDDFNLAISKDGVRLAVSPETVVIQIVTTVARPGDNRSLVIPDILGCGNTIYISFSKKLPELVPSLSQKPTQEWYLAMIKVYVFLMGDQPLINTHTTIMLPLSSANMYASTIIRDFEVALRNDVDFSTTTEALKAKQQREGKVEDVGIPGLPLTISTGLKYCGQNLLGSSLSQDMFQLFGTSSARVWKVNMDAYVGLAFNMLGEDKRKRARDQLLSQYYSF